MQDNGFTKTFVDEIATDEHNGSNRNITVILTTTHKKNSSTVHSINFNAYKHNTTVYQHRVSQYCSLNSMYNKSLFRRQPIPDSSSVTQQISHPGVLNRFNLTDIQTDRLSAYPVQNYSSNVNPIAGARSVYIYTLLCISCSRI